MRLFFFVILNILLINRPYEYVEWLNGLPLYNIAICLLTLISLPEIAGQFKRQGEGWESVTVFVLGILAAIPASLVVRGDLWTARFAAIEFAKVLVYYLLTITIIDTPNRLRAFLYWLVVLVTANAGLALLNYHDLLINPQIKLIERNDIEEHGPIVQLMSSGSFQDPNDYCIILSAGVMISICGLTDPRLKLSRLAWLAPAALCAYALVKTQSRGGFLGLIGGVGCFLLLRFGWRRSMMLGLLLLPAALVAFGGRATRIGADDESAHSRLEFWYGGLQQLVRSPLFGIGYGRFAETYDHVAHNSFVHSSVELGLLGGGCFFGIIYIPLRLLFRLKPEQVIDADLARLRPYLAAVLSASFVGMLSITRCYILTTYIFPAVTVAYMRLVGGESPDSLGRFTGRVAAEVSIADAGLLMATYLLVKILI